MEWQCSVAGAGFSALVVLRSRRTNALRRVGAVVVPRLRELQAKIAQLCAGGARSLTVVADFDRTITAATVDGQRGLSCHGVIECCGVLSKTYRDAMSKAYAKYRPLEVDPTLPRDAKLGYMREWYAVNHNNLVKEDLRRRHLPIAVRDAACLALREGAATLLSELEAQSVPTLIFSAGLADVLEEVMRQKYDQRFPHLTTHVVSNRMIFEADSNDVSSGNEGKSDNDRLVGFSEPLLHMFNKRFDAIGETAYAKSVLLQKRRCVLLLGDGLGDAAMADGQPADCVIRVGFVNERVQESLAHFSKSFDVLVLNDGPMHVAIDIVRAVFSGAAQSTGLPSLRNAIVLG